ncbi:MAG: hypothetical protein VB026_00150 [Anaerolineaceae bacterium]|nr:hypothetical protein [Anaerolineaceae bacterium]
MSDSSRSIPIGKLLRADNSQFVAGCRVRELETPSFGSLVRASLEDQTDVYGLITNISISDDGLVRQLVSGVSIPGEYTADNRHNRNLPVEIQVLTVGFGSNGRIHHQLPPRPPLSLDQLFLCDSEEVAHFTSHGYSYLRHILRLEDQPVEELLTAHLSQARRVQDSLGNPDWYEMVCQRLIVLLRDDYPRLTRVLDALSELE